MTTNELLSRGIGHNCLSDAYDLGYYDAMHDDGVPKQMLEMGYKKGVEDALDAVWELAISKHEDIMDLGELKEIIEEVKEQK